MRRGCWPSTQWASGRMSSRRSRSGGTWIRPVPIRNIKSLRNEPDATSSVRSREAEHTRRTLARRPSGPATPSSIARSRRACSVRGSSPTSSRNSVPPSARTSADEGPHTSVAGSPGRSPNSWSRSAASGRPTRARAANGPSARDERRCTIRATRSLPTPVSPVTSTGWRPRARRVTRSRTAAIARLRQISTGLDWEATGEIDTDMLRTRRSGGPGGGNQPETPQSQRVA